MKDNIASLIKKSLSEEALNSFNVEEIKKGISYKLYSRNILRIITDLQKVYRIEIVDDTNDLKQLIPSKYEVVEKNDSLLQIDIDKNDGVLLACIEDLEEAIKCKKQFILDHYSVGMTFGCCSRYVECSDALRCINPDQKFAKGCIYRSNLENGRVFYGKNKNY